MMNLKTKCQEDEYRFPYHYIAQFKDNNFRQCFLDFWSINYVSTIEFLLEKIELDSPKRIIDIGCGDGRFSRELALNFEKSEVVGIDYLKRAINLAEAMNPDLQNLQFKTLDIYDSCNIEPFNAAVLMEVFEHIPIEDAERFMARVRTLLPRGGYLYITVPHSNKELEYKHFQHFDVKKISSYLTPHFKILEVTPFEKISWKRKIIFTFLNNRFFILNNQSILSKIYIWYKNNLFYCCDESECQRLFVKAVAK